jgi:CheY-like chemotaxis protein
MTPVIRNPLVLVVDDDPRNLSVRREQLEKRDLDVVVARSMEAALKELEASPEMDAILTDLHLDSTKPDDISGVELAFVVKDRFGDIPMVAYSAVVGETRLKKEHEELFVRSFVKGFKSNTEIEKALEAIREVAIGHRQRRRIKAERVRTELLDRHSLERIEVAETVRRLLPHARNAADIEASLRDAGYHLELVRSSAFKSSANPLLVWVKEVQDGVEVEVYGQSVLYAHGHTADEAITKLVELMRLFAEDFIGEAGKDDGPSLRLRGFLERTVEADGDR